MANAAAADTSKVKVLFFAKARELVGISEATVDIPSHCGVRKVSELLEERFSQLCPLERRFILALNEEYVDTDGDEELVTKDGDRLAVIPPISGG